MGSEPPLSPDSAGENAIAATLVTRDGRLAMTLGPARSWSASPGYSLAPLAFPSTIVTSGAGREEALTQAARLLGVALEPVVCSWTYGPSARHAMDREPARSSDAPFLRYERLDAPEDASGAPQPLPRRVTIHVYLARALGDGPGEMIVAWLPLAALRAALGGLWLSALLAMEGVSLTPAANAPATPSLASLASLESILVFTPAGAGERQILRACAKYGDAILFPSGPSSRA